MGEGNDDDHHHYHGLHTFAHVGGESCCWIKKILKQNWISM
jgi:hypothetical protein